MVEASHLAARSGPTAVVDKTKIFIRRKSTSLSADFQHHDTVFRVVWLMAQLQRVGPRGFTSKDRSGIVPDTGAIRVKQSIPF
jgi:hypothetical protein